MLAKDKHIKHMHERSVQSSDKHWDIRHTETYGKERKERKEQQPHTSIIRRMRNPPHKQRKYVTTRGSTMLRHLDKGYAMLTLFLQFPFEVGCARVGRGKLRNGDVALELRLEERLTQISMANITTSDASSPSHSFSIDTLIVMLLAPFSVLSLTAFEPLVCKHSQCMMNPRP